MKKIAFFLLLVCSAPAFALLPPLYHSLNEFKALVESPELDKHLDSGEAIIAIRRTEKGLVVITNKHLLFVEIENVPADVVGPATFKLKFQDPIPRVEGKRPHLQKDEDSKQS